jgi:hypothetical protein
LAIVLDFIAIMSVDEQVKIMGGNAIKFYNLDINSVFDV